VATVNSIALLAVPKQKTKTTPSKNDHLLRLDIDHRHLWVKFIKNVSLKATKNKTGSFTKMPLATKSYSVLFNWAISCLLTKRVRLIDK
jgi:hypothetical protein